MSTYFPYFRGKRNELLALRKVAQQIAEGRRICPILELVNFNSTTRISLDQFIECRMPFIFVTNPAVGEFSGDGRELCGKINELYASRSRVFIPAIQVGIHTPMNEIRRCLGRFSDATSWAVIYEGRPQSMEVLEWLQGTAGIEHHIFRNGRVSPDVTNSVPKARRVLLSDNFRRQARNSDYPVVEHFTAMNTAAGNPDDLNWGDFSILGDHYSTGGGPAFAVAIHHLFFSEEDGSIMIGHYLSDRQETSEDTLGSPAFTKIAFLM